MPNDFHPHIPSSTVVREFSLRATLLGLAFGFFFAVANAYLALKIGTTVSASIPAAILSMALLKLFFKNSTILENNIVQTIATVGEGLAGGVLFTIPALILLGESPSMGRIFILSATGGILGILLMIPMRRYLIVKEHKTIPFPEGTACAEILKAGEKASKAALMSLWGVLAGAVYKICSNALFLWKETASWSSSFFKTSFSIDATPALLGVGYIIGPRICAFMLAGGAIAWWAIIPLISLFGGPDTIIYPSTKAVSLMGPDEIWDNYIRYIGAGTLATGGILSLFKIIPLLRQTLHASFQELFSGFWRKSHVERTEKDISLAWLILGTVAITLFLWLFPSLPMNFFTILLLIILSFFFVAVTSITVGLIGSTSNPVSGMTITTLLITCLIFVMLGWTERAYLISAMTMGCVSCCAITLAGTTAQDLKTGHLLGATPRSQQLAEILGILIPSLALGYVLHILNNAYGIGSTAMPAPQATMMAMIVKGVIGGDVPYTLVGVGVILGIAIAILEIPVLPFAVGLYLPLSLSTATMVGGLVRLYVNRRSSSELNHEKGTLLSAGLIGGDACIGIVLALLTILGIIPVDAPSYLPDSATIGTFLLLALFLTFLVLKKERIS